MNCFYFFQLLILFRLLSRLKAKSSAETRICIDINERILYHRLQNDKRPFITLSFAQTLDGSIATESRMRMNISSSFSFSLKHTLRSLHDGILVGIETLLIDEPKLTVRNPLMMLETSRSPLPIVLDSNLRIAQCRSLPKKIVVFTCEERSTPLYQYTEELLQKVDGMLVSCRRDHHGRCDITECFRLLKEHLNIHSVLVEGGAQIIHSCLELGLVDRIVLFVSLSFTGGYRCLPRKLQLPRFLSKATTIPVEDNLIIYSELDGK